MKRLKQYWNVIKIVAVVAIFGFFAIRINQQMAQLAHVSQQEEIVRGTTEALQATQVFLNQEITRATSEVAVEEWAYEEAHMARPGDQLIVPLAPGDSTPTPQPRNQITYVQKDNWEIWRDLFFSEDSP